MKTCEIHLNYFKKGDDLGFFLEKEKDVCKALLQHSKMLKEDAATLKNISNIISTYNLSTVSIDADCHCIYINGPEELLNTLVEKELASFDEFDDEED